MTTRLAQKHAIKGSREFELVDDEVRYIIKSPLRTESLSVVLNVLDPEPVISGSTLSFVSQVNREPLVELFLDKPDRETFDQFVSTMQRRIIEEDFGRLRVLDKGVDVNVDGVTESIDMLLRYVDPQEIETLLAALEELKQKPENPQWVRLFCNDASRPRIGGLELVFWAPCAVAAQPVSRGLVRGERNRRPRVVAFVLLGEVKGQVGWQVAADLQ